MLQQAVDSVYMHTVVIMSYVIPVIHCVVKMQRIHHFAGRPLDLSRGKIGSANNSCRKKKIYSFTSD
jgi:hypothetical protein